MERGGYLQRRTTKTVECSTVASANRIRERSVPTFVGIPAPDRTAHRLGPIPAAVPEHFMVVFGSSGPPCWSGLDLDVPVSRDLDFCFVDLFGRILPRFFSIITWLRIIFRVCLSDCLVPGGPMDTMKGISSVSVPINTKCKFG